MARAVLCWLLLGLARLGSGLPILASLQPPSGPSTGGTSVTIRGSGFVVGSSMCRFGAAQTVAAVVTSSTQVLPATPALSLCNPQAPSGSGC